MEIISRSAAMRIAGLIALLTTIYAYLGGLQGFYPFLVFWGAFLFVMSGVCLVDWVTVIVLRKEQKLSRPWRRLGWAVLVAVVAVAAIIFFNSALQFLGLPERSATNIGLLAAAVILMVGSLLVFND